MFHRPAAEYCLSRRSVQGLNRMACDEEAINLRGCLKSCTLDNKRNFSSLLMNPGHWRNLVIEKTALWAAPISAPYLLLPVASHAGRASHSAFTSVYKFLLDSQPLGGAFGMHALQLLSIDWRSVSQ
ncbi:hypothetical protein WJX72_009690 [[Myrmecia] bisecta]|uniref:Uncharacterized protein n=1 Tax=[Myrmecia] bisecta TaxID=41462 RepID=A0AAW1PG79_9CHLO